MSHSLRNIHEHRPWPMPLRPHTFVQQWNRVWFMHYRQDPASIQLLLPEGLELDLFEGSAWVSLVGFTMNRARLRGLPFPQLDFDELNLRTYAIRDGRPGVYFLTIEGGSAFSCYTTRKVTGLPYEPAAIRRTEGPSSGFHLLNQRKNRKLDITYRAGARFEADPLQTFLTERYCLYHGKGNRLRRFEVHHEPWPLHRLEVEDLQLDFRAGGIHLSGPPEETAYSPGVEVIAWSPDELPKIGLL